MKQALIIVVLLWLAGCASTEALYAQYDDLCPVNVTRTNTGMMTVTGIVTGGAAVAQGSERSQVWEPAVYFGFDKTTLNEEEQQRLGRDVAVLNQYESLQVSVQSFTDNKGAAAYNRKLASRRMAHVVDYLVDAGIARSRIKQASLGEESPILPNRNENDRVVNRRVELMLLDAQGRPLAIKADVGASDNGTFEAPLPIR
ncbi:OmpA family protein [Alcanivorax hongdengensis]|nr:OmpA family protein [Alcanivorax hongdengensis]